MEFKHVSVLLKESVDMLSVKKGGLYIDMTLGGGGHSEEILKRGGQVLGIDQDKNAIQAASKRLEAFGDSFKAVQTNFSNIKTVAETLGIKEVDGIIADLGVSSHQLDEEERGFSYMHDAPLDMRMNPDEDFSAKDVVNTYSAEELEKIISSFGEERWAKRIAEFIVKERNNKEIKTTGELVSIIKAAVPKGARIDGPHPAKRTFQAIRIEVNRELDILEQAVKDAVSLIKKDGRIAIITFHSLEDRIVKNTFTRLADGCTCPKDFPVCVCGNKPQIKILTKKPIVSSKEELLDNPRSRSAKLRAAEKILGVN